MGWGREEYYSLRLCMYVVCCHEVDSPRKSAAVMGFNQRSIGCSGAGFTGQLKRCTASCAASLHEEQLSEFPGIILAL